MGLGMQRRYMTVKLRSEGGNIKKDGHKLMCRNSTEENKNRYKSMNNKAKKAVSKAMRENLRRHLLS